MNEPTAIESYMELNKILIAKVGDVMRPIYQEAHDKAVAEIVAMSETMRLANAEIAALDDAKTISTNLLSDLKDYLLETIRPAGGVGCEREIGLIDSIDAYLDLHGNSTLGKADEVTK